jgi:hypothetical protein
MRFVASSMAGHFAVHGNDRRRKLRAEGHGPELVIGWRCSTGAKAMANPPGPTAEARDAGRKVSAARADARAIAFAPAIAEIKANGIIGPHAIAAALTARGIRTARGHRQWSYSQVRSLLLRLERLSVAGLINQDGTTNHAAVPAAPARRTRRRQSPPTP